MKLRYLLILLILLLIFGCSRLRIRELQINVNTLELPYLTSQVTNQRNAFGNEELVPPLIKDWEEDYISLPNRGFTAVDNWLFFGTSNGYLAAADLVNGELKGKKNLGDSCPTPPTVYGNILYQTFEVGSHGMIAYDVVDGDDIWSVKNYHSKSSPIAVNKKVYYQSINGHIFCFNYLTGEKIWSKKFPSQIRNSPAYVENLIITAGLNGSVMAHEFTSGVTVWQAKFDASFMADPVIYDDQLYLCSHNGDLYVLDVYSGVVLHHQKFEMPIYNSPTVDNKQVYLALSNGNLIALNRATFNQIWIFEATGPIADAPLVTQSYVYFATLAKHLYVLDNQDGRLLQDIVLEGRARSTPIIKDGRLVLACENKKVVTYVVKS
jgi:outer membrane protein assembly factor BamB